MIKPIVLYGSPVLRKKAEPISSGHENLTQLVKNMYETMYSAEGIGLAAPQIGISVSLFIIGGRLSGNEALKDFEQVFINPKLITLSEESEIMEEGCLSMPGIRAQVHRPSSVRVRYENLARKTEEMEAEGLLARIIQHEFDHLEGTLFTDHISLLKRRMLKRKLADIGKNQDFPYETTLLQKP